ncbi:hypothetical protein K469DRAFT_195120 [Zopfia rhizophila CBS 207.26]|uniref:EZH2 N-terminal domain-containing protein n=1 Tax=Zopfia rhizophila CBS 207.26 TaxID=1314779 RepID=A0A6A6ERS1_9PEZI|nr:hypothetical protein K469DRAFT_195120 [Zopfia rhizophila CBS 207.26]
MTASMQAEPAASSSASSSQSNRGSAQKPKDEVESATLPMRAGSAAKQYAASPTQQHSRQHSTPRTPTAHTPKVGWTIDRLEEQLREFARGIEYDSVRLTTRQVLLAWKKEAPARSHISKENWFDELKSKPVEPGKGTMKVKIKQLGPGRRGKQEKHKHFVIKCIKTNKDPVPSYAFHHVEISKKHTVSQHPAKLCPSLAGLGG